MDPLSTLLGVVLGGLITFLGQSILQRRRHAAEDEFMKKRRELDAIDLVIGETSSFQQVVWRLPSVSRLDAAGRRTLYDDIEHAYQMARRAVGQHHTALDPEWRHEVLVLIATGLHLATPFAQAVGGTSAPSPEGWKDAMGQLAKFNSACEALRDRAAQESKTARGAVAAGAEDR
jgi:hypothetical protein